MEHNNFWPAMPLHRIPEEFQSCSAISALGHIAFKLLTFVINRPQKLARLAINLHEHLVQMPLPNGVCTHLLNAFSSDLCREHRTEHVPSKPDGFVADVDATLVQQVLHISE